MFVKIFLHSKLEARVYSFVLLVTIGVAMKQDRLWRKNRMQYNESISYSRKYNKTCIGVDLNRNFDFQWGTGIEL